MAPCADSTKEPDGANPAVHCKHMGAGIAVSASVFELTSRGRPALFLLARDLLLPRPLEGGNEAVPERRPVRDRWTGLRRAAPGLGLNFPDAVALGERICEGTGSNDRLILNCYGESP